MGNEIDHVRLPVIGLPLQYNEGDCGVFQAIIRQPIQRGFVVHMRLKQGRHFIRSQEHMIVEHISHDLSPAPWFDMP
jgi:hypothetical protein